MSCAEQYRSAVGKVADACEGCGRDPDEVCVVAVSKTADADAIALAVDAGARDLAENRPDRLVEMSDRFPECRWHFIGNIQSRRIRDIVGRAAIIHSLCQLSHGEKISEVALRQGIVQDVLLEVNVLGEASKSGVAPDGVEDLLAHCGSLPGLRVRGLMTMAPRADQQAARAAFRGLRNLRDRLRRGLEGSAAADFSELSMGMSGDWPVAVEEGATLVRIGRAIFADDFQ